METDPTDLRIHIYDVLLDRGVPPATTELARHFKTTEADVKRALAGLGIGKTVLPHPATGEVWMAGPFASAPTPYRVTGRRTTWFANCAWDMLGVAMIANEVVTIDTTCTDCGEPMTVLAAASQPPAGDSVVHFLVSARRWYDDIAFT